MRKLPVIVGTVVVLAALGGGYLYVQHEADRQLAEGLASLKEALGPGSTLEVRSATASALRRGADLAGLVMKRGDAALTVETLHLSGAHGDTVDHLQADGLRALAPGGTAAVDHAEADGLTLPRAVGGPVAVDPLAVVFDRVALHGLHAKVEGSHPGDITAETLATTGYGAGRPGGVELQGAAVLVSGNPDFDTVRLAHAAASGLDLVGLVTAARTGVPPAAPTGAGSVDLDGFELRAAGAPIALLAHLHGEQTPTAPGAGRFATALAGIDFRQPEVIAALAQIGYDVRSATGSFGMEGSYDRAAGHFVLSSFKLDVAGMGALAMSAELDKLPPIAAATPPMALAAAELGALTLSYTDASLVDHLVAAEARQTNRTPDAVRDQLATTASALARGAPPAAAVAAAVAAFIRHPGTLDFAAHPPQPVPLVALAVGAANPAGLAQALNVTATAR